MFVKLIVLACALALTSAAWNGPLAGGSPADRYPAGVSPQACPNYPHCNNPAIAANPVAPTNSWGAGAQNQWDQGNQWNGGGHNQWNGGQDQWNGGQNQWNGNQNQWNDGNQWNNNNHGNDWNNNGNALDVGGYTGDGDYRGEGLAESGAYGGYDGSQGYANQGNGGYAGQGNGGYAGHGGAAQVPAGVDPSSCPNYPFCH